MLGDGRLTQTPSCHFVAGHPQPGRTAYLEGAIASTTASATPAEQVDSLIQVSRELPSLAATRAVCAALRCDAMRCMFGLRFGSWPHARSAFPLVFLSFFLSFHTTQETADAHNLQLGTMLDDAGMVGTATPAGASSLGALSLALALPRALGRVWACGGLALDSLTTSSRRPTDLAVQEEAPAVSDLEQRFAALRK